MVGPGTLDPVMKVRVLPPQQQSAQYRETGEPQKLESLRSAESVYPDKANPVSPVSRQKSPPERAAFLLRIIRS